MENIVALIDHYKKQKSFLEKYTLFLEQPQLIPELLCCSGCDLPCPYTVGVLSNIKTIDSF
jgi:hypothetical protein